MTNRLPPRNFDSTWSYKRALERLVAVFTAEAGLQGLCLFADLLQSALEQGSQASSTLWRPAIEDHEQNWGFGDTLDELVTATRDSAEETVTLDPGSLDAVLTHLRSRPAVVFTRIALHVLRVHRLTAPEIVEAWLLDEDLFRESELRHEMMLLMEIGFAQLPPDKKDTVLGWIEAGPRPDQAEPPPWADTWELDWLAAVRPSLPASWIRRFEELRAELGGVREHPDFLSHHSGFVGPASPQEVADITHAGAERTVDFLKSWEPTVGGVAEPSVLGLARALAQAVEQDAAQWAAVAESLEAIEPTYIHHLLSGFASALKNDQVFDWEPVLSLCTWVVAQPRDIPGRTNDFDRDTSFGPSRQAVARLLEVGQTSVSGELPLSSRPRVWELLRALASDPEPTTDYEREFGGDNMDPPTLAINTVRGVAMHAIIQYGLWVVRNTARDGDESSISLADMPELQQLLEAHLDRSNDPSLAVRSVYGQYFPWLALIDEEWSLQQLDAIFPEDDDSKPYWDAAWWTYVAFCQPYDRMVVVLRGKYLASLRRLDETPQEVAFAVPGHKLVEHIIVYYLRGLIELDDELLLSLFSAGTPVEVRSYAIEFGGRVLQTSTDEQAERWMPRLVALWLSRREAVSSSADPLELIPFGWWFASSQLDDRWALDELRYVLEAAGWVEPDRQVVAQLAQLDLPELDLVECLTVMATNPKDEWSVLSWRDPAQDVIRRGLSSPDASARSAATALANRLAARGYSGFLELL